ncbi:MAG: hypothetical protein ACFFAO_16410 [Candidatus Hermodarchaeota archaeon]
MDLELEYFLSVIQSNSCIIEDESRKLIFYCKKIIELMNYYKETKDRIFVRNALIFLKASYDYVSNGAFGKKIDLRNCNLQTRDELISILKTELYKS